MPTKPRFGIGTLRKAATAAVERASIRSVAAEIGMSYTGLRAFLAGGSPHEETRRRLLAWYLKGQGGGQVSSADVRAAIETLVTYLGEASTPSMTEERVVAITKEFVAGLPRREQAAVAKVIAETAQLLVKDGGK